MEHRQCFRGTEGVTVHDFRTARVAKAGLGVVVSEDSRKVGDGVQKENPCALRYFREKDKNVLDSAVVTAFQFDIE